MQQKLSFINICIYTASKSTQASQAVVDAQTETGDLQLKARMESSFTELFHPAHCLLTAALQLPKHVYQKYFTKPSACALTGISTGEHPLCHHSRTYGDTGKAPKMSAHLQCEDLGPRWIVKNPF